MTSDSSHTEDDPNPVLTNPAGLKKSSPGSPERRRRCCLSAALIVGAPLLLMAGACLVYVNRLPEDAPLARMYRTEADLTALCIAVDTYFEAHEAYPPAGAGGLRLATDHLSRNVPYLPDGPPHDGWDRPFCYVPHTEYDRAGAGAFRDATAYPAPGTYQIYSVGVDGAAGHEDEAKRLDNIRSWDSGRPWRAVYHEHQRTYRENTP